MGDANLDNIISAADARAALRIAAQIESNDNLMLDIINNDGKISASDAHAILRASTQIRNILSDRLQLFPNTAWKTGTIIEAITMQEDYGSDTAAPGNAVAFYLLFSVENAGEYTIELKNNRQSAEIIINLIATNKKTENFKQKQH